MSDMIDIFESYFIAGPEPREDDPDPDRREDTGEWYPDWDGPSDFREAALEAGYDPSDPKAIALEQWGML